MKKYFLIERKIKKVIEKITCKSCFASSAPVLVLKVTNPTGYCVELNWCDRAKWRYLNESWFFILEKKNKII